MTVMIKKFMKKTLNIATNHISKRIVFPVALLSMLVMFSSTVPKQSYSSSKDVYVYVCTGPSSKRYHKTNNCKGLNSCSKEVKKVTIEQAKEMKRTPCKMCYK